MTITQLISLSISVILIENLMLERRVGMERFPYLYRGRRRVMENGLTVLVMLLCGLTAAILCRVLLPDFRLREAVAAVVMLLIIAAIAAIPVLRHKSWDKHAIGTAVCGVNGMLLGLGMLAAAPLRSVHPWLMLPIAAGVTAAYVLLGLLMESLRRRLASCDCPAILRGWPMEVITAAFLILAFMGLR